MKENSIEEDIKQVKDLMKELKEERGDIQISRIQHKLRLSINNILSDYKRVLKENEELTISNKEIDKECNRLEEKEVELINQNEHYKDLICALETYYDITEKDLEECMKNDR